MNSKKLTNAVIEIKGVEYMIDVHAAKLIEQGEKSIALTRLFDEEIVIFSIAQIQTSLKKTGIIDHVDKK